MTVIVFNLIAEKFDPVCLLLLMRWKDIDGIASNPKGATVKVYIVSFELNFDQLS